LSPRSTWGNNSVSSMAFRAPLPPRACSKSCAQDLWAYSGTQYSNCSVEVRFSGTSGQGMVAQSAPKRLVTLCGWPIRFRNML
jgi:hypothetical protein